MVTSRRIALPAILARSGTALPGGVPAAHPTALVTLTNPDPKSIDLHHHRLVKLAPTRPGPAQLIDNKSSGDLATAANSDGFIEIPPHHSGPGPWPFYSWH
jgi:hypothetical protein